MSQLQFTVQTNILVIGYCVFHVAQLFIVLPAYYILIGLCLATKGK